MKGNLWIEKYRPANISDYIWPNDTIRKKIDEYLKEKEIPHLLFHGPPGTGKTTLAKVILNELGVDYATNVMEINGSVENSIDVMRDKIMNFVVNGSIFEDQKKYVLLDEADYLTPNAQAALRNIMEKYGSITRFILTVNYFNRVIPALKSRCQVIQFDVMNRDGAKQYLKKILDNEGIHYCERDLSILLDMAYPDMRKAIGLVQLHSVDGRLDISVMTSDESSDRRKLYRKIIGMFREGKIHEARDMLVKEIPNEEYDDLYRFLYENLDEFHFDDDLSKVRKAIIVIRNGLVNNTLCVDKEINFTATLIELLELEHS